MLLPAIACTLEGNCRCLWPDALGVALSPGQGGAGGPLFLPVELGLLSSEGRAASGKRLGYMGSLLAQLGRLSRRNFWMKATKQGGKKNQAPILSLTSPQGDG